MAGYIEIYIYNGNVFYDINKAYDAVLADHPEITGDDTDKLDSFIEDDVEAVDPSEME